MKILNATPRPILPNLKAWLEIRERERERERCCASEKTIVRYINIKRKNSKKKDSGKEKERKKDNKEAQKITGESF